MAKPRAAFGEVKETAPPTSCVRLACVLRASWVRVACVLRASCMRVACLLRASCVRVACVLRECCVRVAYVLRACCVRSCVSVHVCVRLRDMCFGRLPGWNSTLEADPRARDRTSAGRVFREASRVEFHSQVFRFPLIRRRISRVVKRNL